MTCVNCKKEFNPRKDDVKMDVRGYDETIELVIECPYCEEPYYTWIAPESWSDREGNAVK